MNFLLAEHTKNKVIDSRQRAHVVIYPMLAQGHMKTQDIFPNNNAVPLAYHFAIHI